MATKRDTVYYLPKEEYIFPLVTGPAVFKERSVFFSVICFPGYFGYNVSSLI